MTDQVLKKSLSEMQGKLFETSAVAGYDSESFIRVFMNSKAAEGLDSDFDFLHWAGKEYIFEKITEEHAAELPKGGNIYDSETMYWIGYLYRFWHFYTGESSKKIYKTADAKTMNTCYYGYHTLDAEAAIDRLKEQ